jgi:hypothetical protein
MAEKDPEGQILFETESESLTEAMKLAKIVPGHEYEVVSETEIMEEINKYYDVPLLN